MKCWHWKHTLMRSGQMLVIWQLAYIPMQVLQDYVQRQEYIILSQDNELVP
jgi:hypothetical protein